MLKALILIVLVFYLLALVQSSFLVHFQIFGIVLNISLISAVLISIFERYPGKLGFWSAITAGFFLDIFSSRFFGFWIIIIFLTAVFTKLIFKQYVRIPFTERF